MIFTYISVLVCVSFRNDIKSVCLFFTSPSRIFRFDKDVTTVAEELQNQDLLYVRRLWPLSGKGSLLCYTCCDTGLRFLRSHLKDRPNLLTFTTNKGYW